MSICQTLFGINGPNKESCIALLGGGGKTTLLYLLAQELSKKYNRVLQTSLTKTAFHQFDNPLILNEIDVPNFDFNKYSRNPLFIIGEKINDEKLRGISEQNLDELRGNFDVSIFECDGARNKPLKAHTEYDPQVPSFTTHVIIIVGADVINTKISDGLVHRPELFSKIWKVDSGMFLDTNFVTEVLTSDRGYLSKISNKCEIIYFVNKWDEHRENAEKLALSILNKTGKPTFFGSIKYNVLFETNNL